MILFLNNVKLKSFAAEKLCGKALCTGVGFAASLQNFLDIGREHCHHSRRFANGGLRLFSRPSCSRFKGDARYP